MKAFTLTSSAAHHETHAVFSARTWGMVIVSLLLGLTALPVTFGAAAAFENSKGELIAPCVAAALYLAFCQFWVAPRGSSGFWAKLPTLVASIVPLLLNINLPPRTWGIPWVMVSGCLGSVVGAMIAQWVTATPRGGTQSGDFSNRGKSCRRNLLAGFILLVAIALLISIGVIPSVMAYTASDLNVRPLGVFLGVTVVFVLMVDGLLASAVWRCREHEHTSKGTLGITAFLALLVGLAYCGFGVLLSHGSALRAASVLLLLCAILCLITAALMSVTSVIVDRSRLSNLDTIN